jgi:hypothetical protein
MGSKQGKSGKTVSILRLEEGCDFIAASVRNAAFAGVAIQPRMHTLPGLLPEAVTVESFGTSRGRKGREFR